MDEAVVNSCRVCQSSNQDGDFECLYTDNATKQLSIAGQLYEELMELQVDLITDVVYPQYLCNSCVLQMKLFKKLKIKANKTLQVLEAKYSKVTIDLHHRQQLGEGLLVAFKEEESDQGHVEQLMPAEIKLDCQTQQQHKQIKHDTQGEQEESVIFDELLEQEEHFEILEELLENEQEEEDEQEHEQHSTEKIAHYVECPTYYSTEVFEEITNDSQQQAIDEPDNLIATDDSIIGITVDESTQEDASAADSNDLFMDVHYLDDVLDDPVLNDLVDETENKPDNKMDKRNFCSICEIQFVRRSNFLKHRKEEHCSKYQCQLCMKNFLTNDTLRVHTMVHRGLPPYQCELCMKTFNQKVHYNYHMDKHNNIRNFKCEFCAKAFLSKGDLSIHVRTHTRDHRYSCDICNKDFLLLVHMKNHRYSHFEKEFECTICQQKFVSPSTLRMHTQTIHENEPRFQCPYCVKKFRRKHHLHTHYKLHRKLIEELEYVENESNYDEDTLQQADESLLDIKNEVDSNEIEEINLNY